MIDSMIKSMSDLRELRHALTLNDFVFAAIYLTPTEEQWARLRRALADTAEPTREELNDPEFIRFVKEITHEARQDTENLQEG